VQSTNDVRWLFMEREMRRVDAVCLILFKNRSSSDRDKKRKEFRIEKEKRKKKMNEKDEFKVEERR
jgi:hypothetical protein